MHCIEKEKGQGRALLVLACLLVGLCLLCLGACQPSAEADGWYEVTYVNDGDTVVLAGPEKQAVRYLGIDTPEIDHGRGTAEPFGIEARQYNQKLVLNGKVRLEFDKDKTDRYDRWLAYVFLEDGTFVNQAILAEGYGFCLSKKPNTRYEKRLLETQRKAMKAAKGIWCDWAETGQVYVGNRNSRIFHLPDCPNAKKISPKNRVRLDSLWDAYWAGYAPARGCIK
jgi:micrococcal nuclease